MVLATLPPVHLSLAQQRKFTFLRAWRLRRSEIHVLADRADGRRAAARKLLVLADSTAFAERQEPASDIEGGGLLRALLRHLCRRFFQRTMSAEGTRVMCLASDMMSSAPWRSFPQSSVEMSWATLISQQRLG